MVFLKRTVQIPPKPHLVSKISIMENNINPFSSTEVTNKISSWLGGWL